MSMTDEQVLAESAKVDLEIKRLSLELQQEQLQQLRDTKAARRLKLQKAEEDLAENVRQQEMREQNCKHRKGGRNKEGLNKGNSPNYAVIQNTFPNGEVRVICQRCGKAWEQPSLDLKAEKPTLYNQQLRDYQRALEFPTDNEPSGTQIFLINRNMRSTRTADDTTETRKATKKNSKVA